MARIFSLLIFIALNVVFYGKPVQAENSGLNDYGVKRQMAQKNDCLLVAKNCPSPDYSLRERIKQLRDEIDRGTAAYTQEELRLLIRKLEDARATQDFFDNEAPSQPLAY